MNKKNFFFDLGWSWLKFNNLGLALGATLKFYNSVAKRLKIENRKFLGPIPTFGKIAGGKLVGGFLPPLSPHPE